MSNWVPFVAALLSALGTMAGAMVAFITFHRTRKKEELAEGRHTGVLASDIGYIKAGIDDLKRESKEQRDMVAILTQRVTRCEESCKQAHHRIDEIKK